jgi:hypothetical protein
VKTFSQQVLERLGQEEKLDYLMLNAAQSHGADAGQPGPNGSKWCESYIVNHLCELHCAFPSPMDPALTPTCSLGV